MAGSAREKSESGQSMHLLAYTRVTEERDDLDIYKDGAPRNSTEWERKGGAKG